jgi:hypothetical protein
VKRDGITCHLAYAEQRSGSTRLVSKRAESLAKVMLDWVETSLRIPRTAIANIG